MCPATTLPPEDQPMRAVFLLSTVCLTGFAATAVAQQPPAQPKPKPAAPAAQPTAASAKSAVAGTWAIESSVKTAARKDTLVNPVLTPSPDPTACVTPPPAPAP